MVADHQGGRHQGELTPSKIQRHSPGRIDPMYALVRLFILAVIAHCVYSQPAAADIIADAARNWGLIGTWATDCSQPPSVANGYLEYLVRSNQLWHDREFGDRRDSNKALAARIAADRTLEVRFHFPKLNPPQTREISFVKGTDGRLRTMFNRDMKGEYTVKNGTFVSNNAPTPWQSRCR
jgi:hypothetical protein